MEYDVQFAYGNYADYKSCSDAIKKKVSADALNKLKKLTIVDLAGKQKVLRYADLMSTLDVKTTRELEDLLIDSIFAGMCMSTHLLSPHNCFLRSELSVSPLRISVLPTSSLAYSNRRVVGECTLL